jgi:hypothetical protein
MLVYQNNLKLKKNLIFFKNTGKPKKQTLPFSCWQQGLGPWSCSHYMITKESVSFFLFISSNTYKVNMLRCHLLATKAVRC